MRLAICDSARVTEDWSLCPVTIQILEDISISDEWCIALDVGICRSHRIRKKAGIITPFKTPSFPEGSWSDAYGACPIAVYR